VKVESLDGGEGAVDFNGAVHLESDVVEAVDSERCGCQEFEGPAAV